MRAPIFTSAVLVFAAACSRRTEPEALSDDEKRRIDDDVRNTSMNLLLQHDWMTDPRAVFAATGGLSPLDAVDLDDSECQWSADVQHDPYSGTGRIVMTYARCLPNLTYPRMRRVVEALDIPDAEKAQVLDFVESPTYPPPTRTVSVYEGSLTLRGLWGQGWRSKTGTWVKCPVGVRGTKTFIPVRDTNDWIETFEVTIATDDGAPESPWTYTIHRGPGMAEQAVAQEHSREREEQ